MVGIIKFLEASLLASVWFAVAMAVAGSEAFGRISEWHRTTSWTRRFGHVSLLVDPCPGGIGGEFAGSVDLSSMLDVPEGMRARLSCIHRFSLFKDSDLRETVVWEAEGPMARSRNGHLVRFVARFRVPSGLPPSEMGRPEHQWRLQLYGLPSSIPFTPVFVVEMQRGAWASSMFAREPVSA